MPRMTNIDELLDFSYQVRSLIIQDQGIMALIANDPEYDPDGEDAEKYEAQVKDHNYVDETTLEANAYVVIETEMSSLDSPTMGTMYVYVTVILSKKYMDLDPRLFKGMKGNRRDNIARRINLLLNNNRDFGVGDLHLTSATIGSVPTGFTARVLAYRVPTYA